MHIYPEDILVALLSAISASDISAREHEATHGYPDDSPTADVEIEELPGLTIQIDGTIHLPTLAAYLEQAIANREPNSDG